MPKLPVAMPMVEQPTDNSVSEPSLANKIADRLFGLNGVERYQLWPERLVRSAISAPHDVLNNPNPTVSTELIPQAMDVAALSGTGGLGGVGEGAGAALGSTPFLRPALKYQGKIYKAPVLKNGEEFGEHLDALPDNLKGEFLKQAMSGEDISNFDFSYLNHKGQFITREDALKYAIDNGFLQPDDAKYGALTTTMMKFKTPQALSKMEQ